MMNVNECANETAGTDNGKSNKRSLRGPRFSLARVFLLLTFIGVLLGWRYDHLRLTQTMEKQHRKLEFSERSLQSMASWMANQKRSVLRDFIPKPPQLPEIRFNSPESFVKALRTSPSISAFIYNPIPFRESGLASESLDQIIALLGDPNPEIRRRAVISLRLFALDDPRIPAVLIPMLDDSEPMIVGETLLALRQYPTAAKAALPRLRELQSEENSDNAAFATLVVAEIAPDEETGSRLAEILRNGSDDDRLLIVNAIPHLLPPSEADAVLREAYANEANSHLRYEFMRSINAVQIQAAAQQSEYEKTQSAAAESESPKMP